MPLVFLRSRPLSQASTSLLSPVLRTRRQPLPRQPLQNVIFAQTYRVTSFSRITLPKPKPPHPTPPARSQCILIRPRSSSRPYSSHRPPESRQSHAHYDLTHAARLAAAKPLLTWDKLNSTPTYTIIALSILAALIFYFTNLETVPVSGRTRFNVYGPESVRKAGEMEYRRIMYELQAKGVRILPEWDPRVAWVRRVMSRLIPFSGGEVAKDEWEVYVVDDPRTANAFVLPGGKVFVFTGILGIARTDSGLATVLGHEIAHNVADHVAERLSQDIGASIALWSLVILGGVFGLGPLILHWLGGRLMDVAFGWPMSRLQETEADYIGLMMMAEACFDPREAVSFWARMERATGGGEELEWMSTHPTNISRIKKIQEWLPEAMKKREESDCRTTISFADLFRHALRTGQIIII